MKKLLLLVAATLSTAVYAEEIDGIFGFRFGEVFNMQRQDYEITEDDEVFSVFLENNIKKERISYLLTLNPYDFKIARIAGLEYSFGIDKSGCINGKESYEKSFKKRYNPGLIESLNTETLSFYNKGNVTIELNCFEYKLSNYVLMIQVSNKELLQVAMEAKKRIEKNNVSIFNASKKQYSLPTTTKSSHKQKPVSYTNSPYAIQNDILGGYRAEMEAEAAAKKQNARAYSVDVFDLQAVYRLMTSTMSTTEIVIAFVIWFAIRLVIIVAFYYLARGVRTCSQSS